MLTTEQFYESFDKAGFLKLASWTPSFGGPAQSAKVRFRAPSENVLAGDASSVDFSITYPASVLTGLKRGEVLEVDGQRYLVRESPTSRKDGTELEAKLSRRSGS